MASLIKNIASSIGTGYDYLTPGRGSSRLTDYGAGSGVNAPAPYYQSSAASTTAPHVSAVNYAGQATAANNALQQQIAALQSQISAANKQVYAPALNFGAISAQARGTAEANVNPYYTAKLNEFLGQQAQQKTLAEQSRNLTVENLQKKLEETLGANETTKQRTEQDTAQNLGQVNTQADQYQTDTGQQFTTDRLAQAKQLAQSGLTGGLGAQQQEAAQQAHNTQESRQEQQFQQSREQQVLSKARTFEDLATSGTLAQTGKEQGQKQAELNLNQFISQQSSELTKQQAALESQRKSDIETAVAAQEKSQVRNIFDSISNPAQKAAFAQAYGSYL